MAEYVWIDASGGVRSKSKVSNSMRSASPLRRFAVLPCPRVSRWWSCACPRHGYNRTRAALCTNRHPRNNFLSSAIAFKRHTFFCLFCCSYLLYPAMRLVDNARSSHFWWLRIFCTLPILAPHDVVRTYFLLTFCVFPLDHHQESHRRQRSSRMEFRRLFHRPGPRRQLGCLSPPSRILPRSPSSWR